MALAATHPRLEETILLLDRLVNFPTVSLDTNLELIEFAEREISQTGADIRIWKSPDGKRANLFATLGDAPANGIVLSGHTDVVPVTGQDWTGDPFALREEAGRLYGRGTCDMKGFIACAITAFRSVNPMTLARPLHLALTYDEETGCLGGRQLVDDLARAGIEPSVCVIGEPTSMGIIEGHKGCYEYTTRFTGLEAHGSLTHIGVNAIEHAALYIARLMEIREELKNSTPEAARFTPPHTTLQVGRISGGISRNTIAGDCEVEWEMRPVRPADADHVKAAINRYVETDLLPAMRERHPHASIEVETIGEVAGLTPLEESEARDICCALTGNAETGVVSFGTEAGLFQEKGISTVVCGPGSIEQAHKPDEYIEIAELGRCLNMLDGLVRRISA